MASASASASASAVEEGETFRWSLEFPKTSGATAVFQVVHSAIPTDKGVLFTIKNKMYLICLLDVLAAQIAGEARTAQTIDTLSQQSRQARRLAARQRSRGRGAVAVPVNYTPQLQLAIAVGTKDDKLKVRCLAQQLRLVADELTLDGCWQMVFGEKGVARKKAFYDNLDKAEDTAKTGVDKDKEFDKDCCCCSSMGTSGAWSCWDRIDKCLASIIEKNDAVVTKGAKQVVEVLPLP